MTMIGWTLLIVGIALVAWAFCCIRRLVCLVRRIEDTLAQRGQPLDFVWWFNPSNQRRLRKTLFGIARAEPDGSKLRSMILEWWRLDHTWQILFVLGLSLSLVGPCLR